eukprot:m.283738 g.283738  ORF g.283738 m.283738 type:complete len:313 (-) comp19883_c0_seq2:1129-2067(-)
MFTLILLLAITTASFTGINANKVARDRNDTLSGSRAKSRVFSYVADVVVETTHGKIRGVQEIDTKTGRHVTSFYGIPFAEPPVKRNRFMPPVPVQPWEDTIDCTQKKLFQVCPQIPIGDLSYGREDCLYMNIYVPSDGTNFNATKLPVFMWLYGGAYVFGDKDELGFYDGKNLATSRNVVVVEPNYRVGALGFMSLDAVSQRTGGTTGNQGLQDQRQAMQFAYTNLDRFGGDNAKVLERSASAGISCRRCQSFILPPRLCRAARVPPGCFSLSVTAPAYFQTRWQTTQGVIQPHPPRISSTVCKTRTIAISL